MICRWEVWELTVFRTRLNISSIAKFLVEICSNNASVYTPCPFLPSEAFCPGDVEKAMIVPLGAYTGAKPSFAALLHVTKGLFRQASKMNIFVVTLLSSKISITSLRGNEVCLQEISSTKLVSFVAKKFSPLHCMPCPAKKNSPTLDCSSLERNASKDLSMLSLLTFKQHSASNPNWDNFSDKTVASLTAF